MDFLQDLLRERLFASVLDPIQLNMQNVYFDQSAVVLQLTRGSLMSYFIGFLTLLREFDVRLARVLRAADWYSYAFELYWKLPAFCIVGKINLLHVELRRI